ncbi:hypothetical protein [Marinibactrum halimedae]|uniref:Anticodon nuclease n=1 Tax=Marinibactrum halimedae TaxID=1444977 RepID=A0AA37T3Q9_9GAMM|nr:hypothetical protein [Marinibactrum halimedae]MCD9457887.1 hypothetical protein [Marinibactrum halimedae]GLS26288.1 hypothetical protein GCM10007877_20030 [Marinibactrum halimedae]
MSKIDKFESLYKIAQHFRDDLNNKDMVLFFAYNGTGKTRLSMEFKEYGKQNSERDTLYFNAYTEDCLMFMTALLTREPHQPKEAYQ